DPGAWSSSRRVSSLTGDGKESTLKTPEALQPALMPVTDNPGLILRFGRCQLLPDRGELFVGGELAEVGSPAAQVLKVLIEARGALVTKDEILRRVWSGRVVEDNALYAHVSALRKALGQDGHFLRTISGRGYRFVATVTADRGDKEAAFQPSASLPDEQSLT